MKLRLALEPSADTPCTMYVSGATLTARGVNAWAAAGAAEAKLTKAATAQQSLEHQH